MKATSEAIDHILTTTAEEQKAGGMNNIDVGKLLEGTTPGLWDAVEATEHHGFYVTSDYGSTICDFYTMSNPQSASVLNGGDSKPVPFMHEMDGPNARLAAAAPSLARDNIAMRETAKSAVDGVMEAAKGGGVACQTRVYAALKPLIAALAQTPSAITRGEKA